MERSSIVDRPVSATKAMARPVATGSGGQAMESSSKLQCGHVAAVTVAFEVVGRKVVVS